MDNLRSLAVFQKQMMRKEVIMVANKKQTGVAAAKAASKVLRDGRSGKASKTAAASALAQTPKRGKGK